MIKQDDVSSANPLVSVTHRKYWIDITKAICMIAVYLMHSQVYCNSSDYGFWVEPFYVNAFFFVSGYLFFNSQIISRLAWRRLLLNIIFKIIIPTILFSTIIYIPKALFHNNDASFSNYIINVWGGVSYWFTSALVVAQIGLLLLIAFFKVKSIWFYVSVSFVISLLAILFNNSIDIVDVTVTSYFPWYYKTGLAYVFLMSLGGLYRQYEDYIDKIIINGGYVVAAVIYLLLIIISILCPNFELNMLGLSGRCDLLGFICLISAIILLIYITKKIRPTKWLEYIGKNSIIFYFFSGVLPAAVGLLFMRIMPGYDYLITILTLVVSVLVAFAITDIINKFIPFVTDLRKLNYGKK